MDNPRPGNRTGGATDFDFGLPSGAKPERGITDLVFQSAVDSTFYGLSL
ncbi:hypothetical protein [Mesorhizobium sp. M0895]